jgi:hypothetical protein
MSPSDQRQNHVSTSRKSLFPSQKVKKQKPVNLHEIFVEINLILECYYLSI